MMLKSELSDNAQGIQFGNSAGDTRSGPFSDLESSLSVLRQVNRDLIDLANTLVGPQPETGGDEAKMCSDSLFQSLEANAMEIRELSISLDREIRRIRDRAR